MNVKNDIFRVIFQDSRKLISRSNIWMISLHILVIYIYFPNSVVFISPSRADREWNMPSELP